MIAGIIAAGEGSRLRAGGIRTPKPLVPVAGIPIIGRLLASLRACGIHEVCCIVNEESEPVREYVAALRLPIPVTFIVKSTPSSMHSLFELAPFLRKERFLLTTVDSIFSEADLRNLVAVSSGESAADGFLAVTDYIDDEHPLHVSASPEGRILSFTPSDPPRWVTGGLYAFSPRIFDEMEAAREAGIGRLRHFLARLAGAGYDLRIVPFSRIVDVDRVEDIRAAERMLGGMER